MDPDNQFQDPSDQNDMEDMLMNPEDQMDQPDGLQIYHPEDDNDQIETKNLQKSINIQDESANSNQSDDEITMEDDGGGDEHIQIEDNEEDDFIPDDQTLPESDDNENSAKHSNNEPVKALSEKEEDQAILEETTTNIAMALLPQNIEDGNQVTKEKEIDSVHENEHEKENTDENKNELEKENQDNEHKKENTDENRNELEKENQDNNEVQNLNENENTNEVNTTEEATSVNNDQETANTDQDNQNSVIENSNEGHLSEEGMEVKDDMTPQRITRQRTAVSPKESLSKLPPLQTDPVSDAENLRLLNNFKKRGRLPDIAQRAQLVQYIQREKVNSVISQRFGRAQELQNLLQKYQKAIVDQEVKDRNRDKIQALKYNLESIKEELKQNDKDNKYKIEDEKEKQKDHYYELLQKQDEELDSFERKWNDPNFIQKYAKPSSVLLTMKNMERSMVLTKMFEQAETIHNKVKELEKLESKQAQETAENEMEKEKQKILSKQALEIQSYEQHCSRQIEIMERNYELSRCKTKNKIAKLEAEIQDLEKNPPTSLPPMASPSLDIKMQSVMTPRTIKRYSMYKTQAKKPVLTLNPLKNVRPSKKSRTKTYSSLT